MQRGIDNRNDRRSRVGGRYRVPRHRYCFAPIVWGFPEGARKRIDTDSPRSSGRPGTSLAAYRCWPP